MALKHLSGNPHKVTDDFWWYEENGGITLCVRADQKTLLFDIPWSAIRAALKRKDRKDREAL